MTGSMTSLCERVLDLWRARPERPFCHHLGAGGWRTLCYDDLVRRAAGFARRYRALGVAPGQVVLLVLGHQADAGPAFLGAMLIGAVPSFLAPLTVKQNPEHYRPALARLTARIGAALLVTDAAGRAGLAGLPAGTVLPPLLDLDLAPAVEAEAGALPAPVTGEPALLQHSSGTTGLKKGVALSHRAVLAQIEAYGAALELTEGDVIASWLPLYHDMGLIACLVLPMVTGVPVAMIDPLAWTARPGLLAEAIGRYRATLAWLPNFAFHHLAGTLAPDAVWDLSSLRALINCSEPCKPETFALFARRCAGFGLRPEALQCCYAMAENVFAVTQTAPGRAVTVDWIEPAALAATGQARPAAGAAGALGLLSCGRPVAGVAVRILGPDGAVLPERRVGEIAIAGTSRFDGYFRLPAETARKVRDGWYHSGDLGYLAGGELFVTGRRDDLLILNGRNLYAHAVEFAVGRLPGLVPGRCVALGVFSAEAGSQQLVVVAESAAGAGEAAGIARAIRSAVFDATGVRPAAVRLVAPGWLIKTTSGKISRADNLARYRALLCPEEGLP
jgi:acyl-CoA synthetase (AMP-forming)/AMP-acid ligase II